MSSLFVVCAISCEFIFGFFEFAEFYFDEFMVLQRQINRGNKAVDYAFGTDNHQQFSELSITGEKIVLLFLFSHKLYQG